MLVVFPVRGISARVFIIPLSPVERILVTMLIISDDDGDDNASDIFYYDKYARVLLIWQRSALFCWKGFVYFRHKAG